MNIGQAAERTGVSTDTLRYYIKRGLIEEPHRSSSDYRQFNEESIARIRFILNAKEVGFSLRQIRELLKLIDDPDAECVDVTKRVEAKILEIDERMKALRQIRKSLATLAKSCDETPPIAECPIIRTLEKGETRK